MKKIQSFLSVCLFFIFFGFVNITQAEAATLGTTTTENTNGLNLILTSYCKLLPNSSPISISSIHAYNTFNEPGTSTTGYALYEDTGSEYNRIFLTSDIPVVTGWNVQNVNISVDSNILACIGQSSGTAGFILARNDDQSQGNVFLPNEYNHFDQTFPYNYVGNSTDPSIYVTYEPTTPAQIAAVPFSSNVPIGIPFNVDVKIDSETAFNAVRAIVNVSPNLTITGIHNATSNACNLQYTQIPTISNPSFAGAIFGGSSTGCNVYSLTLTPNAAGAGTVTFTNTSMKAYSDNSGILTSVGNASFNITNGSTPTPTPLLEFQVTNPVLTYKTNFDLTGTKLATITKIFVNGSDTNSTYPTSTSWEVPVTLNLGENNYTIYGKDDEENQTATQTITVNRHTLGDINGDGDINLIDASLFAVDWDKTEDLTYVLSDMNDDGVVNLTDLSILAKLQE